MKPPRKRDPSPWWLGATPGHECNAGGWACLQRGDASLVSACDPSAGEVMDLVGEAMDL